MKKSKKLLSLVLAILLCVGMLPMSNITVFAATSHSHCVCGGNTDIGDHTTYTSNQEWQPTDTLPTTAGYYYLTSDITLTEQWKPADGTYLCLNGKVIRQTAENQSVIVVEDNNTFTLSDCSSDEHRFSVGDDGVWQLDTDGENLLTGGVITGANDASGIFAIGDIYIFNCNIIGNKSMSGGGLQCRTTGKFYNVNIIGNFTKKYGGGISASYGNTEIYGGKIAHNTAQLTGGGVDSQFGNLLIQGTEISQNTALENGGGVWTSANTTVNLSGDTIIKGNVGNNKTNNLYLAGYGTSSAKIAVGTMGTSASIGISADDNQTEAISAGGKDYADNFFSDNGAYAVAVDGEGLELVEKTVQVGQVTLNNGEYIINGSTEIHTDEPTGEGYAHFENGVLTLNNFSYSGGGANNAVVYTTYGLTINAVGTNTIDSDEEYAIYLKGGDLTIEGDVLNLAVSDSEKAATTLVLYDSDGTYGKLNITDVTLNIDNVGDGTTIGILCGDVLIDGSALNVTMDTVKQDRSDGLDAVGTVTIIRNSRVIIDLSRAENSNGLITEDDISITDSYVELRGDKNNGVGIGFNTSYKTLDFNGGTLIIAGTRDPGGAVYMYHATIELPDGNYWWRTDENGSYTKGGYTYNDSQTYIELTTTKQSGSITNISDMDKVYNGLAVSAPTVSALSTGAKTFKYKVKGADDSTYTTDAPKNVGVYTCLVTVAADENYTEATATKDFEISKAALTVTAKNHQITYGEAPANDGVAYSGFVNNESESVLGGELDYDYSYTQFEDVGNAYTITPKGLAADISYVNGTLTVTEKEIGIDWTQPANLVYDGNAKVPTATATGLVNNNSVNITVALTDGNDNVNVGSFTYTATAIDNANYKLPTNVTSDSYTITQAEPTITNPTASRVRRGNALSTSTITAVVTDISGAEMTGDFTWKDGTEVLNTNGTEQKIAVFTPDNTFTNYKACEFLVDVEVYSSTGGGGGTTRYTVKFETDSEDKISSKTVTRNSKLTEPDEPTKDGYVFDGWYTDKDLTEKYDFESKVTKSFTLYAKWVEEATEPTPPKEWQNPFTDVDKDDWYYETVKTVYEQGLMKGITDTLFAPNDNITRGMFVTILYRAEGEPAVNKSMPFADVKSNEYYANAVIWGQQNGIINGISETEFAPNANITREQMAAILYRYALVKDYDVSIGEDTNILSYTDFDKISEYAIPAMQWACGDAIISGKGNGILDPLGNATRAEAAAVLVRFLEKI